jgi:hypothetical protein
MADENGRRESRWRKAMPTISRTSRVWLKPLVTLSPYPDSMPGVGDLVPCTNGGWMILPPQRCQRGHRLGPHRMLIGHMPCAGDCHGGHTTWECLQCYSVTFAPPVGAGCRLLDGAAFKR